MENKNIFISQKDLAGIYSGVQRKVHEEIHFFHSRGYKVFVCAERINKEAVNKSGGTPLKTFRWPFSGLYRRLNYLKRAQSKIKLINPSLVIGHGDIIEQDICYIHNCVHLAYELINQKPIPIDHEVGVIHKKILESQKFRLLVCNSMLMQKDLCQRFNIPIEKTMVIYPEYNPKKFKVGDKDIRQRTRVDLRVNEKELLISLITSGNFKKRNVGSFLKAIAKVKTSREFKILIVGKDRTEDYKLLANELGIGEKVIFGASRTDVEAYYQASDLFVLPALIEEFGRSVLEAMGCGKACIVSRMVGASEILEEESREFIIDPLDESELASKLEVLINDDILRNQLGELNSLIAKKHTSIAKDNDFKHMLESIGFLKEK